MHEHAERRKKLAEENRDAPADTVIRALFQHFKNIRDDEDNHQFASAEECIDHWYNVDMLVLVFDRKDTESEEGQCDHWIRFIWQDCTTRPSIEDISDYGTSLDESPIAELLKEETYPERFWCN